MGKIDFSDPENRILVIAPNINDGVIAAALMTNIIDRTDISVAFINKNGLDELKVRRNIRKIYLLGIGLQNCSNSSLIKFLKGHHDKIYFWINNCANYNNQLAEAISECPNLMGITFGNNPCLSRFLLDTQRISKVRKDWLITMDALANYKKTYPNARALRFQKATYAAEVIAQYNNNHDLTAETRTHLLDELLSDSTSEKLDGMIKLHQKIKEENKNIIDNLAERVLRLTPTCGLIIQDKRIFDRNKIFGELLADFNPAIIQYQDNKENQITEIMAIKHLKKKHDHIAEALKDANYKVCIDKSKIVVKGDWKHIRNIIVSELSL
ncbi:MAG: hypothetical protein WC719_01825 [Patescibacteria group bacterium]|jgi:hypothetical protein